MTSDQLLAMCFAFIFGIAATSFGAMAYNDGYRRSGRALIVFGILFLTPPLVKVWLTMMLG